MIFIAEIGSNHKGVQALAYEMIRKAKESGADIAKFQFDRMPGKKDIVRNAPNEWLAFLTESCDYYNIGFMASIWSSRALNMARSVGMKRYKIAHQMKDLKLAEEIISDGKEVYWSNPPNIDLANKSNVHKVFCFENYPEYFRKWPEPECEFGDAYGNRGWVGYSDHTCGIETCLWTIAHGAKYIEKHFTLNKAEGSIKDNHFSADPKEFEELTRIGRAIGRVHG
jgi:N,N'-diacetyllegionaminate synthase